MCDVFRREVQREDTPEDAICTGYMQSSGSGAPVDIDRTHTLDSGAKRRAVFSNSARAAGRDTVLRQDDRYVFRGAAFERRIHEAPA